MNIFDGHLHTFRFKIPARESISLFKRQFERFNIKKMTFLALPCDAYPGKIEFKDTDLIDNVRVMYFKSAFSPNGYAYAGLEYKGLDLFDKKAVADDLLRQVKLYKKVGYDGMKMYEGHPNMRKLLGYPLCDEVFDKFFDFCEKEGFPILMHLANPAEFWDINKISQYWIDRGCYFDNTYPTFNDLHVEIIKRLEKNPNLKFSLAHWGFLTYNNDMALKYMSFPNTMLDICPGGESYFRILNDKEFWIPFIEKYANRITYGTDGYTFEYGNKEDWEKATSHRPLLAQNFITAKQDEEFFYYEDKYTGIGIDKELQEKILYSNLVDLLGEPKLIDFDYFIDKCEKLMADYDKSTIEGYNLWCMKNDFASMKKGDKSFIL